MRHSRLAISLLLPTLLLGLAAPSAATERDRADSHSIEREGDRADSHSDEREGDRRGDRGDSHSVERTAFYGLYFPPGLPGTGTTCPEPYEWIDPFFCTVERGSWTALPDGRLKIRDMTLYELAFAWSDGQVEPRKTGYDIVVANANLDSSLSGPTWGTWKLYNFDGELMFAGAFVGKFKGGIPAVRFIGKGTGIYEGQRMRGDVARVLNSDGFNMMGRIVEPRSRHHD